MAAAPDGNVYVSEYLFQDVRKIAPDGTVSRFAGGFCCGSDNPGPALDQGLYEPDSMTVDATGNVFVSNGGRGDIKKITPAGYETTLVKMPDIARGASSMATDAAGNLFVSQSDGIRKITATGQASLVLAGVPSRPIAISPQGELYCSWNYRIVKIASDGATSSYAGTGVGGHTDGPADSAQMNPGGLAFDDAGNLYFGEGWGSDPTRYYLRKVTPERQVSTIAGGNTFGYADGKGSAAKFRGAPGPSYEHANGRLLFLDGGRIRRVE